MGRGAGCKPNEFFHDIGKVVRWADMQVIIDIFNKFSNDPLKKWFMLALFGSFFSIAYKVLVTWSWYKNVTKIYWTISNLPSKFHPTFRLIKIKTIIGSLPVKELSNSATFYLVTICINCGIVKWLYLHYTALISY